jgi:transposase
MGSLEPVNLKGYDTIHKDFNQYIAESTPHIAAYPPCETFVSSVVPKLKAFGLTKTEAYMIVNLGLGLPRKREGQEQVLQNGEEMMAEESIEQPENYEGSAESKAATEEEEIVVDEAQHEATPWRDDTWVLDNVVEELGERFPGEEGREQIQQIFQTMKEEFDQAQSQHATMNGNGAKAEHEDGMDVT